MSTTPSPTDATVEKCLHLGHGFHEDERPKVVEILDKIDHRMVGRDADTVRIDLMVNERDTTAQKVTMEGHIAGIPTIVATSHKEEVWAGVAEARDEFIRQFNDFKTKHEPNHRS